MVRRVGDEGWRAKVREFGLDNLNLSVTHSRRIKHTSTAYHSHLRMLAERVTSGGILSLGRSRNRWIMVLHQSPVCVERSDSSVSRGLSHI